MRALFLLMIAIGVALFAFYIASRISPDAVSMAVGMLFGVLAGVPTTMLAMAGSRRRYDDEPQRPPTQYIQHTHTHTGLLPDSRRQYVYTPVGDDEREEW